MGIAQPLHAHWCRRNHTDQVPTKYRPSTDQVPNKFDEPSSSVAALIKAIGRRQLKGSEAMAAIGLKHRPTFLANYLTPAIETGFVTMLYPNSPRHPRQRYLLTPKGLMYFNAHQADDRH